VAKSLPIVPKVSIILTSFNHAKYIREAIDSVLSQNYGDYELIILDDASSDDSWAIIRSYSDPRIRAFRNDKNLGPIHGVNIAISEVASGEYIAIHHSDDVWEATKLCKQVVLLESRPEIGAVFTWAQVIDELGMESPESWFIQENRSQWEWLRQLFNAENHLNHPSALIRKKCYEIVGVYRHGLAQLPDADMWSRVLTRFPIHVIQENLTKHRLVSDRSNSSGQRPEVVIRTCNEWNVVRKNFLSIANLNDIVAIFPGLERFRMGEEIDNKFLFAMACLHECDQPSAWQLGLTWLHELIGDKTTCKKLRQVYSFTDLDLTRLSAERDAYFANLEQQIANISGKFANLKAQVERLMQAVSVRDERIAELNQAVREREDQIAGLLNSKSWRLTKPLRLLWRAFE